MKPHLYNKPLADKYQIRGKVKSGGFGSVYLAKGIGNDHHEYAVKFIPKKYKKYAEVEFQIYEMFQKEEYTHGFVKQIDKGIMESEYFLVMELLQSDLEEMLFKHKGKFSVKTSLMIGLQIIDRIQALHKIGYLHRDIKPDNMAIGMKDKSKTIYLIDFGLSKLIDAPQPPQERGKMIGTLGYMSIRSHQGKSLTTLDDIQSFLYSLIYMIKGDLPWMKMNIQSKADYHKIKIMKQKLSQVWFKSNRIPLQIYDCLKYVRNCKSPNDFDYLKCKFKFLSALQEIQAQNDFIFDWCPKHGQNKADKMHHKQEKARIQKQLTKQNKAEQYKAQLQNKKKRPMSVKNPKRQRQEQQMHEDNKKIIDNEVYEIYRFLEKEEALENKQTKKEIKQEKKFSPQKMNRPNNKVEAKREDHIGKGKVSSRPISANRGKKVKQGELGYEHLNKQLERKIKAFQSMKVDGPRIAINHQKL